MTGAEHDRFVRRMAPLLDIAWRKYRRRQSRRGLQARLEARGVDLETYVEILHREPEERERLLVGMRVTVSRFYRDPPVWEGLSRFVVPALLESLGSDEVLRVWCAGCACGEEPYSVAILWSRLPESVRGKRWLEILATDIDERALERGRRGEYALASVRHVPAPSDDVLEPLAGGRVRVREPWRHLVRFARHDLLGDRPPSGYHLVFCRYLAFTYYRGARLRRATESLERALVHGGALVVGTRETVREEVRQSFEPWPGAPSVYRKVSGRSR